MHSLVAGVNAEILEMEGLEGAVTDLNGLLLPASDDAYRRVIGGEPVYRFAHGRTDAVHFRYRGADVMTVGPGSVETIHRENESVRLAEMPRTAALLVEMLKGYAGRFGG